MGTAEKRWDIFLSHAAEDKVSVARPLADALRKAGARVWLDEHELSVGDSLSQKIDEGLSQSHFGGVILSQAFFAKHWPRKELSGLRAREEEGQKVILPIWHNIDKSTIAAYSPTLADSVGVSTNDGIPTVAANLLDVIFAPTSGSPSAKSPSAARRLVEILDSDNPAPKLLIDFLSFHLSKVAHKIGLRTSVTVRKYEWEGIAFDAYVPYVGHGCALYLLSFTGSWKDPFMAQQELQIEPILSGEIVQT